VDVVGFLQEISMHLKQILDLIKNSVTAWVDDYAPSMGAAIAYYTLFSISTYPVKSE